MIILKEHKIEERYDLSRIRNYMAGLGFEEYQTPMTAEREYSGLIAFRKYNWTASFNYPPETILFTSAKGTGSYCSVKWADIKQVQCNARALVIIMNNGNEVQLWI